MDAAKAAGAGIRMSPEIRWVLNASEEPQQNRFLRWRQLPAACHPIAGASAVAAEHSKIGPLLTQSVNNQGHRVAVSVVEFRVDPDRNSGAPLG